MRDRQLPRIGLPGGAAHWPESARMIAAHAQWAREWTRRGDAIRVHLEDVSRWLDAAKAAHPSLDVDGVLYDVLQALMWTKLRAGGGLLETQDVEEPVEEQPDAEVVRRALLAASGQSAPPSWCAQQAGGVLVVGAAGLGVELGWPRRGRVGRALRSLGGQRRRDASPPRHWRWWMPAGAVEDR